MNKYAEASRASQAARRQWRGCDRKVTFGTAEAAREGGQDIYRCKYCGNWHRTCAAIALAANLAKRRMMALGRG